MKNAWTGFLAAALLAASPVDARELGHYVPGVANIRDLAVPATPGFYYEQYNVHYSTDTYRDRNGNAVSSLRPGDRDIAIDAEVDVFAITPVFLWSTDTTFLGGQYA